MTDLTQITILSAGGTDAATAHAAMVHATNVGRTDPSADVEHVSDELGEQIRRVQVDGEWPQPTQPGGGELSVIRRRGRRIVSRTIAGADLKLHRESLKQFLGEVNVLVLHWKYYPAAALFGVLARAYWLQEELGMSASDALLESLFQFYGIDKKHLAKRTKFLARLEGKFAQGKWNIDLTKNSAVERYPLSGASARDTKAMYRDLEDLVTSECRKVAPELHLLAEVLNNSFAPLILQFAGEEELSFCPGLFVDCVKMAQSVIAPRPNVIYLAEPLVDLRLANDAETIRTIEGFNLRAGASLWIAVNAPRSVPFRNSAAVMGAWPVSMRMAISGALVIPAVMIIAALCGWFSIAMATVGVLVAVGLEMLLMTRAVSPSTAPVKPIAAGPTGVTESSTGETDSADIHACQTHSHQTEANGHEVIVPEAILNRAKPLLNGSHV